MAMKTLHYHPIASFCWKVLIGLYELDVPFEKHVVDLADPDAKAAFTKLSPMGKMPALVDGDRVVLESTILLEHVDLERRLVQSLECRALDRFYDFYVHAPMQKVVFDELRPAAARDPYGVAEARAQLETAYRVADERMRGRTWACGDDFTLADCAAAPALYYADRVHALGAHDALAAYLERLRARPSFARVLDEAAPLMHLFEGLIRSNA
ncbi:MAG: glutathione S-transferase family protein [Labilithrix sp.]|nr:glutathione S-transferase family protein [Labilithrix sp.]MCW5811027.1 glutathione S-transferase family protein [Labilithrix sp.]